MISLIVATADNGVIGNKGQIPWRLSADLVRFKRLTMGHPVIMGRKTYESIGRPLSGRYNIVISGNSQYQAEGITVVNSLEQALDKAKAAEGSNEIFIIGGSKIYELALPLAERLYLTRVKADVKGDTFFKYDPAGWQTVSSQEHQPDENNQYAYEFCLLERMR